MSLYTGRYVSSHGATQNGAPLKINEWNIGDYLRPLGITPVLSGKTHMRADAEGMRRLGVDPSSRIGVQASECGFDIIFRDDGVHSDVNWRRSSYNSALGEHGYDDVNPWHWWANAGADAEGKPLSGWQMQYADKPARIPEHLSETAVTTDQALEFISQSGEQPWCLHLSYIKPHWPYVAPAPYHAMYSADEVVPPIRSTSETETPHPLLDLYMRHRKASQSFTRDDIRSHVIPVYMGLISQIDAHIGRVIETLERLGKLDETLIVFTADHGDYLGDHWLGEKDFFHEPCVRIPLIILDPTANANATRGTQVDALVEAIDLLPTFLDWLGGETNHRLEGHSLLPWLHGYPEPGDPELAWREAVFSEYDYGGMSLRPLSGQSAKSAQIFMVRTQRWKYIAPSGYRPLLFDLTNDPNEFEDLGDHPDFSEIRAAMQNHLLRWALRPHQAVTLSPAEIDSVVGKDEARGFPICYWDETDFDDPANIPRHPSGDG